MTEDQLLTPPSKVEGRYSPVDYLCKLHDIDYSRAFGKPNEKYLILEADTKLMKGLSSLDWSTLSFTEKTYASLMGFAFSQKIALWDVPNVAIDNLKSAARDAYAAIVNDGNSAVGKTFTDQNGNQLACGLDANGNAILNCKKTLDTGEKLEGVFKTANRTTILKTTSIDKKNVITEIDSDGDGVSEKLNIDVDTNNDGVMDKFIGIGANQNSLFDADKQIQNLYKVGQLGSGFWNSYTDWSTAQLVSDNSLSCPIPKYDWLDLDPIGAFYESKTAALDTATSIASKTFRVLNSANVGLTSAQLAAFDINADGNISGSELNGLNAWSDLNEDGVLKQTTTNTNELTTLSAALATAGLSSIRYSDYGFYTAGNANYRTVAQSTATAPINNLVAPTALASSYAGLRNTDNVFVINAYQWIVWSASMIKISANQLNMVGTEGNDSFDINYYAAYNGVYFNLSKVLNFYGGGGNDVVGGLGNDT